LGIPVVLRFDIFAPCQKENSACKARGHETQSCCAAPALQATIQKDCAGSILNDDERQQREMARALNFTRQFTLAAGAVPRLAARLDLAGFGNIPLQRFDVLIVEAAPLRAVRPLTVAPAETTRAATTTTVIAVAAITPVTAASRLVVYFNIVIFVHTCATAADFFSHFVSPVGY